MEVPAPAPGWVQPSEQPFRAELCLNGLLKGWNHFIRVSTRLEGEPPAALAVCLYSTREESARELDSAIQPQTSAVDE